MIAFGLCVMLLVGWSLAVRMAYTFKKACHMSYVTQDELLNPLGPVALILGFVGVTIWVCGWAGLTLAVAVSLGIACVLACLLCLWLIGSGVFVRFDV